MNTTEQSWWETQWFLTLLGTGVGALLGTILPLVITYWMNKKQEKRNENFQKNINESNNKFQQELKQLEIDADITARSRIEWIQSARNTSVNFINACYNLIGFMDIIEISESKQETPQEKNGKVSASVTAEEKPSKKLEAFGNDEKNRYVEQGNVQKHGTLLTLYFGPDDAQENEFIVYLIEMIVNNLLKGKSLFENEDVQITDMIKDLKNALRAYYKAEWKRANGSFKDNEINEKLNSEETYRYVKEKYKVLFLSRNNPNKENMRFELVDDKYVEVRD